MSWPVKRIVIRVGLCFLIAFGLAASVSGLKSAIPELIHQVELGGDPFRDFFGAKCANNSEGFHRPCL